MKKYFFSILTTISFLSSNNLAAGISGQCSQYSSDVASQRNTLCQCTKDYLEELNNDNKDYDFTSDFKKLNSLKAQKRVLEEAKRLIAEYVTNYKKASAPLTNPNYLNEQISQFNNLINQAMLIKSIKEVVSSYPTFTKDGFKFDEYCKTIANEDKLKNVCDVNKKYKSESFLGDFRDPPFTKSLNSFIDLYKTAAIEKPSKDLVDKKLNSMLDLIPAAAEPNLVINLANNFSPKTMEAIRGVNDKFEKCLATDTSVDCKSPYLSLKPENKDVLLKELTLAPLSEADNSMINTMYVENEISKKFNQKLSEAFDKIATPESWEETFQSFANVTTTINPKKLLDLDDKFSKAFGEKKSDLFNQFNNFNDQCSKKEVIYSLRKETKDVIVDKLNKCNAILDRISNQFKDEQINDIAGQIAQVENNIRLKMNNPSSRKNHSLQNYVANKYYRACSHKTPVSTEIVQGCSNDPMSPITSFKALGTTFAILGKISSSMSLENTFTKEELAEYVEACKTADKNKYDLICKNVAIDFDQIKNNKTERDWEQIRRKNWVVYDDKAPNGYRIIEKKSNGRIFAEAAVPAAVNFVPYWLQNYSAKYNIQNMQQQAMYQKQWMWDAQQANNYWMNNVFFQYNPTAISTTNSNTIAGFNFGS